MRAYREFIDLAKRLPAEKRNASIQEARKAMQANKLEYDPVRQTEMLKELVAKVSFLRMTTPKTYRDRFAPQERPSIRAYPDERKHAPYVTPHLFLADEHGMVL